MDKKQNALANKYWKAASKNVKKVFDECNKYKKEKSFAKAFNLMETRQY